MISSRASNRSSLASRITKSEIVIKKVVSSLQYLQICKSNDQKPEEIVYDSLLNYEKLISIMKGSLQIAETKNIYHRKQLAFGKIHEFAHTVPLPIQPLSEQQESFIKPNYLTDKVKQCQQLAQLLEQKQQNQRRAQEQFLRAITQQYQEDNLKNIQAAVNIQRVLNRKVFKTEQNAFIEMKKKAFPQKPSLSTIKNVLTGSFMMLNIKMKETKEYVFRTLLKQFGLDSIVDQIDANMKLKGRALMGLKEYPRLNLKRAFWRWYLSSTDNGDKLFHNAADKLVLYTNINKTTFFYRLLNKVKVREIKVDPKVKRMTMMFYLYTKMYYERPMREFFEKFKIVSSKRQQEEELRENIVKCAELREKDLIQKWLKSVKEHRDKQTEKKKIYDGFVKRLVQVSNEKKKWLLEQWKHLAQKQSRIKEVKQRFLNKMLMTKVGRLAQAFQLLKTIPTRLNLSGFSKASKFEKGLANFAQRTLKRALESFRNEFEEGQAQKKRAVIQLIQCTQGGQKKLYNRWKLLAEKTKLMGECRQMNNLFQTLFFAIKSTSDIVFVENKEYLSKQKTLLQLFKNLSGNVSDTFKRWRQINSVSKIKDLLSQKEKEMVLRVLDGLLKNSKAAQIRNVLLKFRMNRRVIEIQRNFLKRILMSKAGLVVIALRKMQSLPERRNMEALKKASKFEKGLASFAQRTLKRALDSFKNEFEESQAQKKRAVIQLIECTQGGQKRYFNRWKNQVSTNNLYMRCQLLQQFFYNSHKAVNRNFSHLYHARSYSMHSVEKLHKYFTKINSSTNESISYMLEQLKQNSIQRRVNKWFYKAAMTFAVLTKISMQKSLWRLKLNAYTRGVLYDSSLMVKLKKVYNTIRKYYELNLFRAFLMIDKYGKTVQSLENSQTISRHTSDYMRVQGSFREQQNLFDTSNNEMDSFREDQVFLASRKAAVGICENVFNQHVTGQVKRWKYNTQPQKQLEETSTQLRLQHPDTYVFMNQSKAISAIVQKIRCKKLRDLAYGYRTLMHYGVKSIKDTQFNHNIQQRIQLINEQNKLMSQAKEYKKENGQLIQQIQEKESNLDEANKAVAVLSLRINFMITSQFIGLVEKVMNISDWRHFNQGFDAIIQKANNNFQQEQQEQVNQGEEEYQE